MRGSTVKAVFEAAGRDQLALTNWYRRPVRQAASDVDTSATSFVESAKALQQQIDAAKSDLEFEATSLGNGGPVS